MNNLYDKPMNFNSKGNIYQNTCLYKLDDADKEVFSIGACFSGLKNNRLFDPKMANEFFIYIRKDKITYPLEDLKRWLRFLRYCGFKFLYLKEETIALGKIDINNPYITTFYGDVFTLKLKCADYINNLHIFAALTAMRYIFYNFNGNPYGKIPKIAFELKKELKGNIDGIQALLLAYHCSGIKEIQHAFIGYYGTQTGISMDKKEFYTKLIERKGNMLINTILFKHKPDDKVEDIRTLYALKDFKGLKKFIK